MYIQGICEDHLSTSDHAAPSTVRGHGCLREGRESHSIDGHNSSNATHISGRVGLAGSPVSHPYYGISVTEELLDVRGDAIFISVGFLYQLVSSVSDVITCPQQPYLSGMVYLYRLARHFYKQRSTAGGGGGRRVVDEVNTDI